MAGRRGVGSGPAGAPGGGARLGRPRLVAPPRRLDRRARPKERGGREKGGGDQALGRSRGGWGTKVHLRVERKGRPVVLLLSGGQAGDSPFLRPLLETGRVGRRLRPKRLAADRAYSHPSARAYLRRLGIGAVIPTKSTPRRWPRFDGEAYRVRSAVARCAGRLKEKRRVATRHEKLASSYLAMLHLAAILMWI